MTSEYYHRGYPGQQEELKKQLITKTLKCLSENTDDDEINTIIQTTYNVLDVTMSQKASNEINTTTQNVDNKSNATAKKTFFPLDCTSATNSINEVNTAFIQSIFREENTLIDNEKELAEKINAWGILTQILLVQQEKKITSNMSEPFQILPYIAAREIGLALESTQQNNPQKRECCSLLKRLQWFLNDYKYSPQSQSTSGTNRSGFIENFTELSNLLNTDPSLRDIFHIKNSEIYLLQFLITTNLAPEKRNDYLLQYKTALLHTNTQKLDQKASVAENISRHSPVFTSPPTERTPLNQHNNANVQAVEESSKCCCLVM